MITKARVLYRYDGLLGVSAYWPLRVINFGSEAKQISLVCVPGGVACMQASEGLCRPRGHHLMSEARAASKFSGRFRATVQQERQVSRLIRGRTLLHFEGSVCIEGKATLQYEQI